MNMTECFGMEDHQFTWGHRDWKNSGDIAHEGRGRNTWICIKCGKYERNTNGGFRQE